MLALLFATALYGGAGFYLAPALVESAIRETVAARTGREALLERVTVDPFLLRVGLRGFGLTAVAGAPAVSADRVEASIDLRSVILRRWVFRDVSILRPSLRWRTTTVDGAPSVEALTDLLRGLSPAVTGRLLIRGGLVRTMVEQPASAITSVEVTAIDLTAEGLAAAGARGRFEVTARIGAEGELTGSGALSLAPATLTGDFLLRGWDLAPLGPSLLRQGRIELASAALTATARVRLSRDEAVVEGDARVERTVAHAPPDGRSVLSIPALQAADLRLDLASRRLSVRRVDVDSPRLVLTRTASGGAAALPLLRRIGARDDGAVVVDRIAVAAGRLLWVDETTRPPVRLTAEQVEGELYPGGGADDRKLIALRGRMGEGQAELLAHGQPSGTGSSLRLTLSDLAVLSPYVVAAAGRTVETGALAVVLSSPAFSAGEDHLRIANLRLGDAAGAGDGPTLPIDLGVALLEDEHGVIRAPLPLDAAGVAGAADETTADDPPGAGKASADGDSGADSAAGAAPLADTLRAFLGALTADPFAVLGAVIGRSSQSLDTVAFDVGSAALAPPVVTDLTDLAGALRRRPRLDLVVHGAVDPVADREALAAEQVRLHVALAASSGRFGRTPGRAPAFDDPKIQSVLDEFAAERLAAARLASIEGRFAERDERYYGAVFDALVAGETVSESALRNLARFRARSIAERLRRDGVDGQRLIVADSFSTQQAIGGAVHVSLALRARASADRGGSGAAPVAAQ